MNDTDNVSVNGTYKEADNPFDKCVLLNLTIRKMGLTRKANKDFIEVDADKDMINTTKRLLDCKEIKDINAVCLKIKKMLDYKAVPGASFIKEGIYTIPLQRVQEIDSELVGYMREFNNAVENFLSVYPERRDEAMLKLNVLANPKDYPTTDQVRKMFSISYSYVTLGPPKTLKEINEELWKSEWDKMKVQCATAAEDVRNAMREAFLGLVDHLTERLKPDEEGNKKRFHETAITNFKEFMATFNDRNITGDGDLADLVKQANNLLEGRDIKSIRKNGDEREFLSRNFDTIKEKLNSMIVNQPKRMIELED
jgi:hypothetical protein